MSETPLFPDVLGYISGGARMDFGVVQAAAAVKPNPAQAGKPIDVMVILQNMTDAPLEILAVLNVPPRDLNGKSGVFVAKAQRLAIGMQPGEVGLLTLPLLTQPVTAPGEYKLALQITGKATAKASRIRAVEGGGDVYLGTMPVLAQQAINDLRELKYAGGVAKRGGLFGGTPALDVPLTLEAGVLGSVLDRQADYRTLWSQSDYSQDPRLLLEKHKAALVEYVLPTLDRARLHEAFMYRSIERFKDAGFNLKDIEATLISSVMVRVLEYACTKKPSYGYTLEPKPEYAVMRLIETPLNERPAVSLRWLVALLNVIEQDPRHARFSSKFLPENCYDGLLRDALDFALNEFEPLTGIELGTPEMLAQFAGDWIAKFEAGAGLSFSDVYLPLVIVGIALHDPNAMIPENIKMVHTQMQRLLEARKADRTEHNSELFDITRDVLEKILAKYEVPPLP